MTKNQICPNCRSTFEINGNLDFVAPALQTINCPVCSQGIWLASGLFPQRWTVGKITSRQPVTTPPVLVPPPDSTDSVWKDFEIPGQDAIVAAGQGLYKIGIWIVIVLVIILLIKYQPIFKKD